MRIFCDINFCSFRQLQKYSNNETFPIYGRALLIWPITWCISVSNLGKQEISPVFVDVGYKYTSHIHKHKCMHTEGIFLSKSDQCNPSCYAIAHHTCALCSALHGP